MLEGLADEEVNQYLQENPKIVPLFEINVAEAVSPYILQPEENNEEPYKEVIRELRQAQEALEREMAMSQRVKASQLEEVNLGTTEDVRPVHITKEMTPNNKTTMITLLQEFRDVFAWSYEEMRGLDPQLYQHQIDLNKHAKLYLIMVFMHQHIQYFTNPELVP